MILSEMTTMRKLMLLHGIVGGKAVEDYASGNPCVFTTDIAKPLKRLALSLLPRQSGSGDPSPSNIRPLLPLGEVGTWTGGKNLLQVTAESATKNGIVFTVNADGSVVANGTATGTSQLLLNRFYFAKGVAYKFNGIDGGSNQTYRIAVVYYTDDGTYITEQAFVNGDNSLVIPQNAEYADIYIRFYTGVTANNIVVSPMIRFASTDDAFVPPTITPHPVNLQANLLDSSKTSVYGSDSAHYGLHVTFNDGVVAVSGTSTSSGANVSFNMLQYADASLSGKGYKVQVFDVVGTPVKNIYGLRFDNELAIAISFDCSSSTEVNTTFKISVSEETLPSYQPYLPPVYGCELDLTTGEVWGTWAGFSKKWSEGESATDIGSGITRKMFPMVDYLTTGQANNICNIAPYSANETAYTHFYYSGSGDTNRNCRVFLPSDTPDDTEITVITKLKNPVLLATLTPQQISAIVGVNTVWSDADNIDVTYLKKG